jgi:CheY-like chemotaxis protein
VSRILLVGEPDPERTRLQQIIGQGPHTVRAVSPFETVEIAREWSPDIIIMDLATDGNSLPVRINMLRDPELAAIPFVALGDSEEEARAFGANAFVRKPAVDPNGLLELLAAITAIRYPLGV